MSLSRSEIVGAFEEPSEFVATLFRLVSEPALKGLIRWGVAGDSIVIEDTAAFTARVLAKEFAARRIQSFQRCVSCPAAGAPSCPWQWVPRPVRTATTPRRAESVWQRVPACATRRIRPASAHCGMEYLSRLPRLGQLRRGVPAGGAQKLGLTGP